MKLFSCPHCGLLVYFESRRCERCGSALGYVPEENVFAAFSNEALGTPGLIASGRKFCANHADGACNWTLPANDEGNFCLACRHNRTIPDLAPAENRIAWLRIEQAKHALFYSLLRLRLPHPSWQDAAAEGLAFDFLAERSSGEKVMTGHDNGRITISLAEANDGEREQRRVALGEPYRTLLGHFRHEIGHYYWDRLVRAAPEALAAFRALFGDDTMDYDAALQRYYAEGPPADWQARFQTKYASLHPWEDFAECFAHYLHIVDTLEMAGSVGLRVDFPSLPGVIDLAELGDTYGLEDFSRALGAWVPLSLSLNSVNRAMGQPDLYPFILPQPAAEKLAYIHRLVRQQARPVPAANPGTNRLATRQSV